MRFILACVAACFMFLAPPAQAQGANDLSGVWQGVYWGDGNAATVFQATLRDDPGPGFGGSIVEVNNFGDMNAPFLLALIDGRSGGATLQFVKTYDGTGGVSHSVSYQGRVLSGGRRIVGTWQAGDYQGQFEMAR